MELAQLEQLVAIAEYKTISAAAEHLHISQPAVSRSIHQLERELGQELFVRTRNSAELNDAGRIALNNARKILASLQTMRDELDEYAKRLRTIRVGSCAPAPTWMLTDRVVRAQPGTILSTEYLTERDLERALMDRSVDLAILKRPLGLPTITTRQMMTESLSVMVPPTDELASRESVSWEDLNGRAFLVLEDVGFWMDVVRENLPDSQLVIQHDRTVFSQLINSSELLNFVTDATFFERVETGRIRIPITGVNTTATFFLACLTDAGEQVRKCLELF